MPSADRAPHFDPDDVRVGDLLPAAGVEAPAVVLVGFPSDEGVRRNGGRTGAKLAPALIRQEFRRLTPGPDSAMRTLLARTVDLGDVPVSRDVEADQRALAAAVAPWLGRGAVPIVLGGGHETSFGHFLAYAEAGLDVSILNWDAHPDVRPLHDGLGHSGSPFRQALVHESGRCRHYAVAGLQPHRVADTHVSFVRGLDGACYWRDDVSPALVARLLDEPAGPRFVSFDMDAVDAAEAPGVSAPATNGLTAAEWLAIARAAGRSPHTSSMDLVEVNPRFDVDGRTTRLAAVTIWAFLQGLAGRLRAREES